MPSADNTGNSETFEELVEKTRGPRARILDGLRFYNGEAHGQRLRQYGDVPSGTYHFEKLEDHGLIEQTGREYISDGGQANVYRLTDLGQEVGDELTGPSGKEATVTELENQIDQLFEEIENLKQAHNEMADFVENLDDRVGESK